MFFRARKAPCKNLRPNVCFSERQEAISILRLWILRRLLKCVSASGFGRQFFAGKIMWKLKAHEPLSQV